MTPAALRVSGGIGVLLAIATASAAGPPLLGLWPEQPDFLAALGPPSLAHPMGTDDLGRDVLARVLVGGRVSLLVSSGAVLLALLAGVPLGLACGLRGGWLDGIAMRGMDAALALPGLLLALALAAVLGASAWQAGLAIALVNLPVFARLARGQARLLRGMAFVMAARGIGMRETAIVLRCILPNAAPPLLAQASVAMAQAMMMEASLSFLGLGVQPPQPSWGGMLRDALGFADQAVWLAWSPAAALFLAVAGLTVASDGLRDWLHPHRGLQ